MNTYNRIWIVVLAAVIVLATPTAALAQERSPYLPPPPDWPIIGPVLRWLGFEGTPEPAPAFDPNYPEHRLATVTEAQALWERLAPNERVRVIVRQEDVNTQLREVTRDVQGLSSVTITFESGAVTLAATVGRSVLESIEWPFLIPDIEIDGQIEVALEATDCRPTLTVKRVRLGGFSLPLRQLAQTTIDEYLPQDWLPNVCIERVFMLPGEFAVEGYRR